MNKKHLFIGTGVVLLTLIIWGNRRQRFVCGDGVCHQKQEFAAGVCPKDCGEKTLAIPNVAQSAQPNRCHVASIKKLTEGSFPKWSPDGQLIAFNKLTRTTYEIYTMRPDGTNIQCLTCNKPQLPKHGHKGQPYWHPSGNYIVFSAQNTDYQLINKGYAEQPDAGRNHNVWIMTKDGDKFWPITNYPENWGVIKPTFSNDGNKIFWNEEFSMEKYPEGKWTDIVPHPGQYWNLLTYVFRRGEELGAWRVVYADFSFKNGVPIINNLKKVNPPKNFTLLEASGFTPDDEGFLLSYTDLKKTAGRGLWGDLYTTDLAGSALTPLTFSVYNHDENAEYSPSGQKIAWSSSSGLPGTGGVDLYLMDADGKNKGRLTHFGEKSNKDYLGNDYSCRELGWSPDGNKLAVSFGTNYRPYKKDPDYYFDNLYLVTFEGACGR